MGHLDTKVTPSTRPILDRLNRPWVPYLIIASVAFVVHGLLLLNDGIYWDAWLIYPEVVGKNWQTLYDMFRDAGFPWITYENWFMGVFPDVHLAYRIVAIASILCFGMLVYAILEETKLVRRFESLWIALFCVSYPVSQIMLSHGTVFFVGVPNACLFACTFLALKSENCRLAGHILLRISALLFFIASFSGLQYFLPFYYGLFALHLHYISQRHELTFRQTIVQFLPRRLDYALVPIVAWFVRSSAFPQQGLYANQYTIRTSPLQFLRSAGTFIPTLFKQFFRVMTHAIQSPTFWALLLAAIALVLGFYSRRTPSSSRWSERPRVALMFGVLFLFLGMFPFVVTGRVANQPQGWIQRYLMLMPLPLGILICSLVYSLLPGKSNGASKFAPIALMTILLAFASTTVTDYLAWQARWVKDRSLMFTLGKDEANRAYSMFWIEDQFPQIEREYYRFYEWSSMFESVWGDERRLGVEKGEKVFYNPDFLSSGQKYFTPRYHLGDFDPAGCQATLVIRPGSVGRDDFELVKLYFKARFFKSDMSELLANVTEVRIEPVNSSLATHCNRPRDGAEKP